MIWINIQGTIVSVNDNYFTNKIITNEKKIGDTYFIRIKTDISQATKRNPIFIKYSLDDGVYYDVSVHEDFYKPIIREIKINQII